MKVYGRGNKGEKGQQGELKLNVRLVPVALSDNQKV